MAAGSSAPVAKTPPGQSWRCAGAPATTWRTNFAKEICRWNMSSNGPIDLRQDRREWLKGSAAALGASLLPLPALGGEQPQTATPPTRPGASSAQTIPAGRFFTPAQHTMVEELSETIIPADKHSGGAKAAKVADYIEQCLRETTNDEDRALWHEGLRLVDLMSKHYTGKSFVDATPEERLSILTVLSDN